MADLPPIVGVAEAAEILSVGKQQISRLKRDGRMPSTVADLRATPVWLRADIEVMAGGGEADKASRIALLGLGEVSDRLGIDKSQIGRWRRKDRFPKPAYTLRATPLWRQETIAAYERERMAAAK